MTKKSKAHFMIGTFCFVMIFTVIIATLPVPETSRKYATNKQLDEIANLIKQYPELKEAERQFLSDDGKMTVDEYMIIKGLAFKKARDD